jgi:hypothetical protein
MPAWAACVAFLRGQGYFRGVQVRATLGVASGFREVGF